MEQEVRGGAGGEGWRGWVEEEAILMICSGYFGGVEEEGWDEKSKQFVYSVSNFILNNVLLVAFHSVKSLVISQF